MARAAARSQNGVDPFLAAVSRLQGADSPADAVDVGAHLLKEEAAAPAAGLIAIQDGTVAAEAWPGLGSPVPEALRGWLERLARETAKSGPTLLEPGTVPIDAATWIRPFPLNGTRSAPGAGCLIWTGAPPADSGPGDRFEPLIEAVANRVGEVLEVDRARVQLRQYERWFKRLDDQLRVLDRERQKFTAIVNQSDTFVLVTDAGGVVKWTNKAMSRFQTGSGAQEWLGLPCREICEGLNDSHCGAGREDCPVAKAMTTNRPVHQEVRHLVNGSVRNLYLTALPIKGPDGRPDEAMVMIQDLSDLGVLRKSESRYRILFERSSNAIIMVQPESRRIVMANAMARRMLDTSMSDMLKLRLEDLHPPDEWLAMAGCYEAMLSDGGAPGRECRIRTTRGEERIAEVFGSRFEDDGRDLILIEFRDLTDRRRAESALVRVEERLRRVVENAPLVLFSLDRDGRFTLSEGRGLERLGLEPGAVVGQSVYDIYRDHPNVVERMKRALSGEEFTEIITIGDLAFETWAAPLYAASGEPDGLIGVATDVTETKNLELQLRHAQKMEAVGRLAGGVAHDFNNLLTVIMGHAEMMMNRAPRDSRDYREARSINQAGIRGSLLAGQLLAFSRKDVVEARVLDLNVILPDIEEMVRRLIGEDIALNLRLASSPALVLADRGQLEQVLMNLAVNARDAMPDGGRLTVEIGHVEIDESYARTQLDLMTGSYVVMAVSDTGCGMDEETRERLFEPFFTTKARGKGTGLGLAIIYGIVRQAGGDVHVYSEPGRGSTFRIFLPRVPDAVQDQEAGDHARDLPSGSETILLTEDEEPVRALAKDILEMNGYNVLEADSGETALEIAAAHEGTIHLLLTDVVMPGMGGGRLANALTERRPGIRVLYMSGYPDDAIVRHGILDANAAFIQKPFSLDGLSKKIRDVLDHERPHESWPES